MSRIAGISYLENEKGERTKIVIDLKRWGNYLEDFIDRIEAELNDNEKTVPWTEVKEKLDKKHKLQK
jgi:hypothetical protein